MSGITGWQPIFLANVGWNGGSDAGWNGGEEAIDSQDGIRCLERIVGGLELVIKFAHHDDLDRVVDVARSVGWAPNFDVEYRDPNLQGDDYYDVLNIYFITDQKFWSLSLTSRTLLSNSLSKWRIHEGPQEDGLKNC